MGGGGAERRGGEILGEREVGEGAGHIFLDWLQSRSGLNSLSHAGACMYVRVFLRMYACIYACGYVYVCMCMCICACVRVCICMCLNARRKKEKGR